MVEIFELVEQSNGEEGRKSLRIGVRMTLGNQESLCPLTPPSQSFKALAADAASLKRNLDNLLDRAKSLFEGAVLGEELGLRPDMNAAEIWSRLSATADDDTFMRGFNGLEEGKRREVAEHVLTKCNIFSGRAAFFSERYIERSARIE